MTSALILRDAGSSQLHPPPTTMGKQLLAGTYHLAPGLGVGPVDSMLEILEWPTFLEQFE